MIDISKDGVKGRSPNHAMGIQFVADKQVVALAADGKKKDRHNGRPIIYNNVEKLRAENLAIPFRAFSLSREQKNVFL